MTPEDRALSKAWRAEQRAAEAARRSAPVQVATGQIASILKDFYGEHRYFGTYAQRSALSGRRLYELRRQRVMGIPARTKPEIAKAMGIRHSEHSELHELMYRRTPFFSMVTRGRT